VRRRAELAGLIVLGFLIGGAFGALFTASLMIILGSALYFTVMGVLLLQWFVRYVRD
jgi:hypothetical protein